MQFPAYCTDKDTKGLVYVATEKKFSPSQHIYVRAVDMPTLEEIQSVATNDHDVFMGLKSKGYRNLKGPERELFNSLKLKEAQLIEPIQ